jgi:hypothetical protein
MENLDRLCRFFCLASRLALKNVGEVRRAQHEKQISAAATRRFQVKPEAIVH